MCKSHGIKTGMFLMWGYEGEELSDIEATIEHVKNTAPDIFFTTVAYPIKGTPYFTEVADRVQSSKPWTIGSDREVRIRGRHSRQFYSFADKLLRSEVELERLRNEPVLDAPTIAELQTKVSDFRAGLTATAQEVEA
jgi:radical SAM superfamily enzyme YgiQ (UPF0313 family)